MKRVMLFSLAVGAVMVAVPAASAYGSPPAGSSASPFRVLSVGETGPSRGITGFSVLFNRAPSRASARDVDNYTLYGVRKDGKRASIDLAKAKREGRRVKVTAAKPFAQGQFRRLVIKVKRLRDARGALLDGDRNRKPGGTAVFRFRLITGTTVRFRDSDGDRAELNLLNGGQIDGIAPIGGPKTQHTQFWILDPIALRTTLNGSVSKTPNGDGLIVIAEISGLDTIIRDDFRNNRSFKVNTSTIPNAATGIG